MNAPERNACQGTSLPGLAAREIFIFNLNETRGDGGEVSSTSPYSSHISLWPGADTHEARSGHGHSGSGCQPNDIPLTDELTALKLLLPEH